MARPSSTTVVIPQPVAIGEQLQLDLGCLTDRQRTTIMQALSKFGSWLNSIRYEGQTLVCSIKGGDAEQAIDRLHSAVTSVMQRPTPSPIKLRRRFH